MKLDRVTKSSTFYREESPNENILVYLYIVNSREVQICCSLLKYLTHK